MKNEIGYAFGLLRQMQAGYKSAKKVLAPIFFEQLSPKKCKQYRKDIDSLYFNFALMFPMFIELAGLKESVFTEEMTKKAILVSGVSLLEDILLDEIEVDVVGVEKGGEFTGEKEPLVLVLRGLEKQVNEFASKQQVELLSRLHVAQFARVTKDNVNEISFEKGIWLPALANQFVGDFSPAELDAFTAIGAWIKIADDYADREKDQSRGVITVFSDCHNEKDCQSVFSQFRSLAEQKLKQLPYNEAKKHHFWEGFLWQTYAFIAFEQLVATFSPQRQKRIKESRFLQFFYLILAVALNRLRKIFKQ